MKQILPPLLFLLMTLTALGQSSFSDRLSLRSNGSDDRQSITIYPNPATSYIEINNGEKVARVVIFNMVGRQMKAYNSDEANNHYFIGDLPRGMYLVQLFGANNEVITTKRVNKR